MFRSILVPLDGSLFGEHALPIAAGIARRSGTSLHLVRVVPRDAPPLSWAPGLPLEERERRLPPTEQEVQARLYLEAMAQRLARAAGVPATSALLTGEVAPALRQEAAEVGAELIVLTTHGRGGVGRAMLGSVADALVRTSAVPVLAVRGRPEPPSLSHEEPIRRILLPLDGSAGDERIVREVERLGGALLADFVLLRVIQPTVHGDRPTAVQLDRDEYRRLRAEAEAALEPVRDRLARLGFVVQACVVADAEVHRAIRDFAAEHQVSLIAMATHGRQGVERLVKGSVAGRVLHDAAADMLLVHA